MSSAAWVEPFDISYSEIASATNNFSDDNLVTHDEEEEEDSSVKVYKGQLLVSGELIDIEAHVYQQLEGFLKEVQIICALYQKNLTSVVACVDNDGIGLNHFFVVKKHEANGSLDRHLSGSTLTWLQRLHICVGIARALSCLHYNDQYMKNNFMIHGNINSSNIFLDDNWQPKLQSSKFSMLAKRNGLQPSSQHTSRLQYLDPAYETTGGLTHKSDTFSFGVVLFEVLFGRKASISNHDNWHFAHLARLHFEEGRLDEMIDQYLRKQMDLQSLKFFSETAYFCLEEERYHRPEMNQIVKRLERALELQNKHQCPPEQSNVTVEGASSTQLMGKHLDHLRIPLSDILSATEDFSETYCIGSGGYGKVYKAKLNHFDGINSSTTKRRNKDELCTTLSTVAIKRIFIREDKHGEEGFLAEIEMLSKCKHPNVVTLLGFCSEGGELILVYEYASKGSLADYFESDYNIINLTWAQRIQICLDIAHGLKYLHTHTQDKENIIHRDIKSANILLDDKWVAKIADFGLSKLHDMNQQGSTLITFTIAGTDIYLDPEYKKSGKLKKASDIYSFGVVMFEIFCGRMAYDNIYNEKGLISEVREHFNKETLMAIVDPKVKEAYENIFMLNTRFHQDSLGTFIKIAYQCLEEIQRKRPTIEVIIKELQKALELQKHLKDDLQISLEDIKFATRNFNDGSCVGEGRYWKIYEGKHWIAKRWDSKSPRGRYQFLRELEILSTRKHENIIGIVGYCMENGENVIVYEHSPNGRLDKHLNNPSLTWMRRLKICIGIASGLEFLHAGGKRDELAWIHRDIKSGSILLDSDWNAKLCNLELSSRPLAGEEIQHVTDNAYGSLDYVDPQYKLGFLQLESDMYSLGVVLLEILCGRLAKRSYIGEEEEEEDDEDDEDEEDEEEEEEDEEEILDKLVFECIRDQIVPESLTTFLDIALQCLDEDEDDRPDASEVVEELENALEFQEDHEIWKPKLPKDYEEIFRMSSSTEMCSTTTKKNLYNTLIKGVLLQKGKVWFSLGTSGERNEMISARFAYKNRKSHSWKSISTSRFQKVAEMSNISKLNTLIKMKTQLLSPGFNYGVYLVFKFFNPRKASTTPMYVNLTYKMGNETLHSYFATWRDDEWMMIELSRCLAHSKEVDFKVLLESVSRCYCPSSAIYIEGIEFREINNVSLEKIEKSKAIQERSPSDSQEIPKRSQNHDDDEMLFLPSKTNKKKHYFLTAKEALHNSSNKDIFNIKPSADSRFEEVIEVLAHQVLHIKCKIGSQLLSPDTQYSCCLVFKLSEKCQGLHCPVRVRDLLRWNNKKTQILYFRSPSPLNRHNTNQIPEIREDECMEVSVWEGNLNGMFRDGCFPLNMKLISYEGNMSGLIVYGLEFRPM